MGKGLEKLGKLRVLNADFYGNDIEGDGYLAVFEGVEGLKNIKSL